MFSSHNESANIIFQPGFSAMRPPAGNPQAGPLTSLLSLNQFGQLQDVANLPSTKS
jgi:hypothetical protein